MDRLLFNAGDPNLWNQLYATTVNSVSAANNTRYYPIPRIEVPIASTRRVLACYATSNTALPHWKSAGYLGQKIRTGLLVGGLPDASYLHSQRILLNQINLLHVPTNQLAPEYSIYFDTHAHHEDISLQIWEYTGPVTTSTEQILIEEVLSRLLGNGAKLSEIGQIVEEIATYNN